MAIDNSARSTLRLVLLLLSAPGPASPLHAQDLSPAAASNRVHHVYSESLQRWQRETNNPESAWQFARACFDWADFAPSDSRRAAIAEEGISASRKAVTLQPKLAAPHYYLGLNLGHLAQTKMIGAFKLIVEMETTWKQSLELDPRFDFAGTHRSLGLLYLDAPGWPTSIGSRTKARHHLQKAVELAPEYPGNRLCLLEAQLKWGEAKLVRDQIETTEEALKLARARFPADEWARDWQDWDLRWRKIKAKAAAVAARSPKQTR